MVPWRLLWRVEYNVTIMPARHRSEMYDLARVHAQAQQRKFRDIEVFERVVNADRQALEDECRSNGLAVDERSDEALRRSLLAHYR